LPGAAFLIDTGTGSRFRHQAPSPVCLGFSTSYRILRWRYAVLASPRYSSRDLHPHHSRYSRKLSKPMNSENSNVFGRMLPKEGFAQVEFAFRPFTRSVGGHDMAGKGYSRIDLTAFGFALFFVAACLSPCAAHRRPITRAWANTPGSPARGSGVEMRD
jgi:hypothetical protein